MKNLLRAFAPIMIVSAACGDLYKNDLQAKVVYDQQTDESIAAHKKAADDKRKRKAKKLKRIFKKCVQKNQK